MSDIDMNLSANSPLDASASAPRPALRPVQVLLVEDSPVIRDSLIDLVESDHRCMVGRTTDGETEARAALQGHDFQIAIIDLQLREGSGLNVLSWLQHQPDPPLRIVLTNFAEPRVRAQCLALGADYFFDKSREFEEVSTAIDRYLSTLDNI
ncbi:response regulator [Uliginosibacterium sp. sgz301328]|uniref:response regulator n=1 Tax=Uliginosibacterium sp. sgz301328 TaxID=3243764 RepID=UPI00359CDF8B